MPASPNAMTAGQGTSTIVSTSVDIQRIDSRSAPFSAISIDYRSWTLVTLVLVIALLLRFSIAATLPLVEPTEGRYAQISQEMAFSGDWVTPRLLIDGEQVPFLGKPPLFFWSAALSSEILVFCATSLSTKTSCDTSAQSKVICMGPATAFRLDRRR